ncbi:hypothetical protein [Crinalium epipsammum]|uniref:hypothetical protein n=1 Tax=Crinalium epipsammum TaxID=241425 RepID=UPI0002EB9F85|nr:hypothetical protein [Crinalium epipsammum]
MEILENKLFEAEEDLIEQEPQVLDEIKEAKKAYHKGDYQTLEEYIVDQSKAS